MIVSPKEKELEYYNRELQKLQENGVPKTRNQPHTYYY